MHVEDILDYLGIRVKLPQHWYSTDVGAEFEEAKLIENDEIIKIEAESGDNTKVRGRGRRGRYRPSYP